MRRNALYPPPLRFLVKAIPQRQSPDPFPRKAHPVPTSEHLELARLREALEHLHGHPPRLFPLQRLQIQPQNQDRRAGSVQRERGLQSAHHQDIVLGALHEARPLQYVEHVTPLVLLQPDPVVRRLQSPERAREELPLAPPRRPDVAERVDGVGGQDGAAGLGGQVGGELEPPRGGSGAGAGAGEVEGSELGEDHDAVGGVNEDGAVAGPGGAELGEDGVAAGQGVAGDEGLGRVGGVVGGGVAPEVDEAEGGGDGVEGAEGEEGQGEAEPQVVARVEGVEEGRGGGGGHVAVVAVVAVAVVVVGRAEGEEAEGEERRDEAEEGRGGEGLEEELGEGSAHDDLAEREGGEDLVEGVLRQPVDRRRRALVVVHGRRSLGLSLTHTGERKREREEREYFRAAEIGRAHV